MGKNRRVLIKSKKKAFKKFGSPYFSDWYGLVHPERLKILKFNLSYLLRRKIEIKRILDVGCALGEFLKFCEEKQIETYGTDISEFALLKTRKNIKAGLMRLDASKDRLPFENDYFDAVTIFDIVEHLKSTDLLFSEVHRVLKKDGIIFLTTPNLRGAVSKIIYRFFPDDPTHINSKGGKEWKSKLVDAGFRNINIKGVIFHGFPPIPAVRKLLQGVFRLNSLIRPIFSPFDILSGTLYITATKND